MVVRTEFDRNDFLSKITVKPSEYKLHPYRSNIVSYSIAVDWYRIRWVAHGKYIIVIVHLRMFLH